jgi:chromosome segregation ATPase
MAHLQSQLEESKLELLGQTTHLRNQVHDLEARNAELLERVVSLTQKERALAQKVVDTRFEGSGVAADKQRLETEVREIKRRQTSTTQQLEEAQKAQTTAESQIEENQRRLQTLEEELHRARRRATNAARVGEEAEKARAAAEANLQMTREKIARLETELLRSRQASAQAAVREPGQAAGDPEELKSLQDVVSDLQMAVKELQSVVNDDPDSQDLAQPGEIDENKDNEPRNTA